MELIKIKKKKLYSPFVWYALQNNETIYMVGNGSLPSISEYNYIGEEGLRDLSFDDKVVGCSNW